MAMVFGSNAGYSDSSIVALNEFHGIPLAADLSPFEAVDRWLTGKRRCSSVCRTKRKKLYRGSIVVVLDS